jgi:hypothetical protein
VPSGASAVDFRYSSTPAGVKRPEWQYEERQDARISPESRGTTVLEGVEMVAEEWRSLLSVHRVFWVVVAVVVIAVVVGAVVVLRPTSTSREHVSLADVKAALVPLSAMPTGTRAVTLVAGKGANACTTPKPPVAPLVRARANYVQDVGPKAANGFPSAIRTLNEVVSVYAKGTSAQRMNDLRVPRPICSALNVAAFGFPRLASDQVSYLLTDPHAPLPSSGEDFIALPVNDSAVMIVSSTGPSGAQTEKGLETFARNAYARAKSKLGG